MFQKASKAQAKLRCAIFGPSGSGKTYSSLRIATGMGGKIALIDTERGSASLYADKFDFDVCELTDRTIEGYCEAFHQAATAGYDVLIIDTLSHAWEELLDDVSRLAKAKFGGNTWAAWSEGTPRQRRFIDALLDFPGHVFATIRSKTDWTSEKDERTGKNRPVRVGLSPQQGKGIEYEFTFLLEMNTDHFVTVIKDRTGKFQDKIIEKPGEEFGKQLVAWLAEGKPVTPVPQQQAAQPATPAVDQAMKDIARNQAPVDLDCLNQVIADNGITEQQVAAWCEFFRVERLDQLTQDQVDGIVGKILSTLGAKT